MASSMISRIAMMFSTAISFCHKGLINDFQIVSFYGIVLNLLRTVAILKWLLIMFLLFPMNLI
jgi:hypothetical protein